MWFGGIGTYIKAQSQSNLDVGDRANDAVRVNGSEVQALVVGEGANLGVTQLGRIEYARSGGRIDTDAMDNSAGVDTSDHEVNLKILLSGPYRRGEMDGAKRDAVLAAMTDDVADLVLADNYDQTLALSVAEASSARDLDADARFIRELESRGKLDRAVEFLPGDAEIATLAHDGKGLTRPELAVLLAYAKLDLDADILASALPDDPALTPSLAAYFPPQAATQFAAELPQHRLKREIISTGLANRIVNLAGPVFAARMKEMSGASGAEVARAFVVAEGAFGLDALKQRIDALDGKIPAAAQTRLYTEIAELLRRLGLWFLGHVGAKDDLAAAIALFRGGVEALRAQHRDFISKTTGRGRGPHRPIPGSAAGAGPRYRAAATVGRGAGNRRPGEEQRPRHRQCGETVFRRRRSDRTGSLAASGGAHRTGGTLGPAGDTAAGGRSVRRPARPGAEPAPGPAQGGAPRRRRKSAGGMGGKK